MLHTVRHNIWHTVTTFASLMLLVKPISVLVFISLLMNSVMQCNTASTCLIFQLFSQIQQLHKIKYTKIIGHFSCLKFLYKQKDLYHFHICHDRLFPKINVTSIACFHKHFALREVTTHLTVKLPLSSSVVLVRALTCWVHFHSTWHCNSYQLTWSSARLLKS